MGMIDSAVGSGEGYVPTVHLDMDKKVAKDARQYRPGQVVEVTVIGTVQSLTFRKPDDPEEAGYEGSMCLKITSMEVELAQQNDMAELLDDDD